MKTINYLLALVAIAAVAFTSPVEVETLRIDIAQSTITWIGEKVGGSHTGNIGLQDGSFKFEDDRLVGGSFVIDMTSISNTDLEGEMNQKLVGHLKSDDFFGVASYPTSALEITEVVPQGPGKYKVTANLTIKDKTKEIKFPATVTIQGSQLKATADIIVDRSEFDVRYGSGSFFDDLGDKVIYDDFKLTVVAIAAR